MGKSSNSSTSTKSKTKAQRKSISKTNKLYYSKIVGDVLDKVIEDELKKVKKHPKTVGKWLSKMKSSILKKISTSTPFLFRSESTSLAALDSQLGTNLKIIESTKEQIIATSRQLWHENHEKIKEQQLQDFKLKQAEGKKNVDNSMYSEKVNSINQNIDLMASQLSSIGKDIESRVASLGNSIQAAEKLWVSNPLREQKLNVLGAPRTDYREQDAPGSVEVDKSNDRNRTYRDMDAHLNEY